MEESNKFIVDNLSHLLNIARDGDKGYEKAAENAKDADLKTIFQRYASQRKEYAGELQDLIRSMGGEATQDGDVAGALHRTWLDIKESLSGHDRHTLLTSCESGEQAAKEAYTTFFADTFEYRGGGSTLSPFTVTGGTNRNYESTGLDTGNGSDTSSEGYGNSASADRRTYSDNTEPNYGNSSDSESYTFKRASSTTMSDMDMDASRKGNEMSPNTKMPVEGSSLAQQKSELNDPETELSHRIYNTVRMQLEGIERAHDMIISLKDHSALH